MSDNDRFKHTVRMVFNDYAPVLNQMSKGDTEYQELYKDANELKRRLAVAEKENEELKAELATWKHNYDNARAHAEIHAEAELNVLKANIEQREREAYKAGQDSIGYRGDGMSRIDGNFEQWKANQEFLK